jgi:hypothetical protein
MWWHNYDNSRLREYLDELLVHGRESRFCVETELDAASVFYRNLAKMMTIQWPTGLYKIPVTNNNVVKA